MKKWLNGSSAHGVLGAILGGILAVPTAPQEVAAAEGFKVTVNGFARQRIGFATNREEHSSVGKRTDVDSQSDSEIHFNAKTTLDNGIKIRGHVELEGATAEGGSRGTQDIIDEQYIVIDGGFGRLVLGSENSAAYMMHIRPRSVGIGIGEANEWVTQENGVSGSGDSAIENTVPRFEDNDSDKITYYTPRFGGLQLGVSYIPNAEQDANGSQASIDSVYGNGFAAGINYKRKFDSMSIGASVSYATWFDDPDGHPERPEVVAAGLEFGIGGLTVTGAFQTIDSLYDGAGDFAGNDAQDGYGYTVGMVYKFGKKTRFGAVFHHGVAEGDHALRSNPARRETREDEGDIFFLSARRDLGPGVRFSVSAFYADWEGENPVADDDNDGWAIVSEIRLNF